jgi:lantibiotic biosynthesis protein
VTAPTPTWRPVLAGDEATAARRAVAEITAALAPDRAALGHDLADGVAGMALLFGYRSVIERDDRDAEIARELLAQAGDQLAEVATTPSLFHGFAGVAWASDHVAALLGERDLADNDEIDAALTGWLGAATGAVSGFDLVTGLVGLGVYALERRGHPAADRCAALVVERLAATAQRAPDGRIWWTAPGAPDVLDLGLAHGVPGAIALLARCAAQGGATGDTARGLLPGAVRWLLALRGDGETAFPATLTGDQPGDRSRPARSAWCYGDAAVALALVHASQVGEPSWLDAALAIARHAALRPPPRTRVHDATLCHGAAALALIYQRLYHATHEPALLAAARAWSLRILDYRAAGGFPASAGFFRATLDEPVADRGLMNGAAGIGLVLLAASSDVAPDWDRALLLG